MRTLSVCSWAIVLLVLPGAYAAANCVSEIVTVSGTHTLVDRGNGVYTHAVYPAEYYGLWAPLPGAQWVWESPGMTAGNFTFVEIFKLEDCVWDLLANITLVFAADDQDYIYMNGEHVSNIGDLVKLWTLDLTPWARKGTNTLEMVVDNWWIWGGIVYQLTISLRDP